MTEINDAETRIPSAKDFSQHIEKIAAESGEPAIDVLMSYCTENEFDPDTITKLITPNLRRKLECEAMKKNLLKEKANHFEIDV